jgi:recombination protein RecA
MYMTDDLERFLANARGSAATAKIVRLDQLHQQAPAGRWDLSTLRGRLVELSARGASGTLTSAMELVVEAQAATEPVCWVTLASATFYPPDAANSGVDLASLVVVRGPDIPVIVRAAERVLRSGAFGLVVIDFGRGEASAELSMAHQGRLVTLAQTHDAAVVCLTEKSADAASLGSLVSLRIEALRHDDRIDLRAIKDKRRGPGWTHAIARRVKPSGA